MFILLLCLATCTTFPSYLQLRKRNLSAFFFFFIALYGDKLISSVLSAWLCTEMMRAKTELGKETRQGLSLLGVIEELSLGLGFQVSKFRSGCSYFLIFLEM